MPCHRIKNRAALLIIEDQGSFHADQYLMQLLTTAQLHGITPYLIKDLSRCAVIPNVPVRPWLASYLGEQNIIGSRFNTAGWVEEVVRELFVREGDIDHIYISTVFEDYTDAAQTIAEYLRIDLPLVLRPIEDRKWSIRDKFEMRERWRKSVLYETEAQYVLECHLCLTVEDAKNSGSSLLDRNPAGIILKPRALASSLNVELVQTADVLEETATRVLQADFLEDLKGHGLAPAGILIEPFCSGPQFSVEAAVQRGEGHILALIEKRKGKLHNTDFGEMAHIVPAPSLKPGSIKQIHNLLDFVVRSLGIWNSVIHLEFVLSGEKAIPIEVAIRPAGGRIPLLLWEHKKIDPLEIQVRLNLGLPIEFPDPILPDDGQIFSALISARDRFTWKRLQPLGDWAFPAIGDWAGRWGTILVQRTSSSNIAEILALAGL